MFFQSVTSALMSWHIPPPPRSLFKGAKKSQSRCPRSRGLSSPDGAGGNRPPGMEGAGFGPSGVPSAVPRSAGCSPGIGIRSLSCRRSRGCASGMQIPALGVRVSHPASGSNPLGSCEALAKKNESLFPFPCASGPPTFLLCAFVP